jgi:ABC-type lipoprotein release transport system permease subunit
MNHPPQPPAWIDRFLRWRLPAAQFEEVQGDMHELYGQWVAQVGKRKATLLYLLNSFAFLRPLPKPARSFGKKKAYHSPKPSTDMLAHFFLLAWRTFNRYRGSFLINLTGLASGLTCVLLIYLWVSDELKVDKFHQHDSQLYQVLFNMETPQGVQTGTQTAVPLAAALPKDMPEVERAVSVDDFTSWRNREGILSLGEKHITVKGLHAGRDFFNAFSFDLRHGNKDRVLADKSGIAISEELAIKLFGTPQQALGKTLAWSHPGFEGNYTVAGIFAPRSNSSMAPFDVVFTIDVLLEKHPYANEMDQNWCQTFVVLRKETDVAAFNHKLNAYWKAKQPTQTKSPLLVQQYSDRYLYGQYENGVPVAGRMLYVRLLSITALFILLIACVNFMNLSTAQASQRMKEIGVKKVLGVSRPVLVAQYLSESILLALASWVVAILLVLLLLPQFNALTGKHLQFVPDARDVLAMTGIVLFTGLVAGLYPALYLSGFQAATVLKKRLDTPTSDLWIRKGLVVFQFTLAIVFIVGFLIINQQIEFTQTKNLGYNKDNIVTFPWKGQADGSLETFMSGLKNIAGVVNATGMHGNILNEVYGQSAVSWRGQEADRNYMFKSPVVGYDFIETLGIELREGRSYQQGYANERTNIILNEAAVQMMGIANPVGKSIAWENSSRQIIGVVKDFHYGSLHEKVEPLIFRFDPTGGTIMVKIKAGTEKTALAGLKQFHAQFLPRHPFAFTFMDADYQALYESESKTAALSNYFAVLAILISCLGLLGLAAFTAQRRRKEISIRKVLGASQAGIAFLLSGEFTRLVLVAVVIALPVSYFLARKWLESFAYRIDLVWWHFAGAGLLAVLIAWLTVVGQAVNAARTNPVKALNQE